MYIHITALHVHEQEQILPKSGPCAECYGPFQNSTWPFPQSYPGGFSAKGQEDRLLSAANQAALTLECLTGETRYSIHALNENLDNLVARISNMRQFVQTRTRFGRINSPVDEQNLVHTCMYINEHCTYIVHTCTYIYVNVYTYLSKWQIPVP